MNDHSKDRLEELKTIVELTKTAKEKALDADLTFEAYLLHTALLALIDQVELEAGHK